MSKPEHTPVAIDVSKDTLEALIQTTRCSYANNPSGWRKLLARLRKLDHPWVYCEASGGYERGLMNMLHKHHISVTLINPVRVRAFARSEGIKAKNDPIDTEMIARFARQKRLNPTPPPPHPQLTALMDRRRHLVEQLTREKTRLQNSPALIHASIRAIIRVLERELKKQHTRIRAAVSHKPHYQTAASLLTSIQGVGEVTTWSILAYLPEITQLSRNRVVALAGLAPFDRDSGKTRGRRHIQGGRHKVREALYMASVCAATHNPHIRDYVDALIQRGKPYKCAITAAMRKILIHCHATLKKQHLSLVA